MSSDAASSIPNNTVDQLVGGLVVLILGFGLYSWARAAFFSPPAKGMMGMMPRTDPIWYLFGTLITASIVVGIYIFSRDRIQRKLADTPTEEPGTLEQSSSQETVRGPMTGETPAPRAQPSVLDYLPEDERQVIEPILETPGLTQVELRGRSDFSKAKVSQTVSELENRGLIYRERQGRTYKIYPGELLKDSTD